MSDGREQNVAGLSRQARTALERRLLARRAAAPEPARIQPRADRTEPAPASSAQRRLWFLDQLEPTGAHYVITRAFRIRGELDLSALEAALSSVVERHDALRTVFDSTEEEPRQRVEAPARVPVALVEVTGPDGAQRESELRERLALEAGRSMDLARGPLLRVTAFRLEAQDHVLLLCVHHIVADGWSMGVLVDELSRTYDACRSDRKLSLPRLSVQYGDYALWQQDRLGTRSIERGRRLWRDRLGDAPTLLDLPTDRPRPREQSFRGAEVCRHLDGELVAGLHAIGRREGVTLFVTLLTAFAVLLHRCTGQRDLCVGSPSAGRSRVELEGLIGLFVNTLVLRIAVPLDATFRQSLAHVRDVTFEAFEHQDVPFELIVEDVQPDRHLNASPLFQVMFALQSVPPARLQLDGLEVEPIAVHNGASKLELSLFLVETDDGIEARAEYSTDLFDGQTVERLLRCYQTLLEAAVENPDAAVDRLALLTRRERSRVLTEWNATARAHDLDATLQALFEAQAERTPEAVAIVDAERTLSYEELNRRANVVAHRLRRRGVGPGDPVGVHLGRSLDLVVALLGVLKAGAAYVPLDPDYPPERLSFMVEDARLRLVLTDARRAGTVPDAGAELVLIEPEQPATTAGDEQNPERLAAPSGPAYVIYTSGSTGTPKGVVGLHRGTVNRLRWMWETYPFEADEVCCFKTSINFVDSVAELFGPLLGGVPSVIIAEADLVDPARLVRSLAAHRVTRIVVVPSLLKLLLETVDGIAEKLPRLRLWTCSGEALPVGLVARFRGALPQARLLNIYGSSEVSADATCFEATHVPETASAVPIGRPIDNMATYVLDANLEPMPVGATGELYLAGAGLCGGYLHRPELDASRFIPNPIDPERFPTLFETGDRAAYRADGNLLYHGRRDQQVKIRGIRIEPEEIEHALRRHDAVQDAVVVSREDGDGDLALVAYVVPGPAPGAEGGGLDGGADLRAFLRERLPEYMLPGNIVAMDALPLTPSGKVDRRSLPAPTTAPTPSVAGSAAPSTELEIALARIWEELLGLESVGAHDDFFDLGGHSFLAVRLVTRIERELGRELAVFDVFERPTVHAMARLLDDGAEHDSAGASSCVVGIQPRGTRPPFFFTGLGGGHLPRNLSRHLGPDRPFFAMLSLEDMEDEDLTDMTIPDLASRYVSELRRTQREGPYYLGAFCGQGTVGYEIARQLESQGEAVAFLGIFEAPAPGRRSITEQLRHILRRDSLRARSHWRNLSRLSAAGKAQYVQEMARSFGARLAQRVHKGSERVRYQARVRLGRPVPDELRRAWSVRAAVREQYAPEPLHAPITLFLGHASHHMQDNVQGWEALTAGGTTVHLIPGAHTTMLEEPNVQELGMRLAACLEEAESASEACAAR